jgi:hypothetical protein
MLCQRILTLRVRPLQLSFRAVGGFASHSRSIDKALSRTADGTLTAMDSSFEYFLSASATQMV